MLLPAQHFRALEKQKALFCAPRTSSAAAAASQHHHRGSQLQPASGWGFFGGKMNILLLLLKAPFVCVCALKTDILVGGSLLGQLSLII